MMQNKKQLGILFLKVAGLSFLITLLLTISYVSLKPSPLKPINDNPDLVESTTAIQTRISDSTENDKLKELMNSKKASGKQVKPSFDKSPADFFSANKAFSLDFHKLPVEFLVPQPPETTRKAMAFIRELKEADLEAVESQQKITNSSSAVPPDKNGVNQ